MADESPPESTCSFERGYTLGREAGVREGYLQGRLSVMEEATERRHEPESVELATAEVAIRFGLVVGQRCRVYRNNEGFVIGATAEVSSE